MAGTVTIRDLLVALNRLGDNRPILELVEWWAADEESFATFRPYVDGSLRPLFPNGKRRVERSPQPLPQEMPTLRTRARRLVSLSPSLRPLPPPQIGPDQTMRRLGVDCVFSVTLEHRSDFSTALMVWVYDLQHHHFPELLPKEELERRNRIIAREAEHATRLLVKSESVRADLEAFLPQYRDKIRVIHFVSDIPADAYAQQPQTALEKYNLPAKFIYLPNQFWQHKNHLRVIAALDLLHQSGIYPVVVCTGSTEDHRNPEYIASVLREIERAQLQEQFLILGTVPRNDVFALMRQSLCVLNPSVFEGFGLSASEATSLGKRTLLADLPCLREQNPPDALFFDPNNTEELAERLNEIWSKGTPGPDLPREATARAALVTRQQNFAREFVEIAREAVNEFHSALDSSNAAH